MRNTTSQSHSRRAAAVLLLAALAFAVGFMLLGPPRGEASGGSVRVSTAQNKALHKRVLVNVKGLTLYSLSVETHGHFVCTDPTCVSTWKPLALKAGQKPIGVKGLGTIRRPDGHRQVTYKGKPLYSFYLDARKGDANGEGFKDVGTWHAAVAPK